jgi:VanZ family protein
VPPETVVDTAKPDPLPLDKWRHFVAYAGLGWALAYALTDWSIERKYAAAFVIGTTIAYGVGIEFGQSRIPERYFSLGDAYANALGGVLVSPWYLVRPYVDFESLPDWIHRFDRLRAGR